MANANPSPPAGSLTIVGTGIALGQVTAQSLGAVREAEVVLTVIPDAAAMAHVAGVSRRVEDLIPLYEIGKDRRQTYAEMADRVMTRVRDGLHVCFALYGHPGVLSFPAHAALRAARAEGFAAEMLPGISAEACLLADLGLDPGDDGLQSYEASRFLLGKIWDPTSLLILWQVGAVGDAEYRTEYPNRRLGELTDKLVEGYGPSHPGILYEAATLPMQYPRVERIALGALMSARLTTLSTLCILPSHRGTLPSDQGLIPGRS